ncbi:unnamed protein product [Rotaria sordida]|uniref:Uncharacterized protein n=1 Tax=Rotaria sordida TaxID=392033 RepID=A0A814G3Q9_9BILA|nr:unnamed protein product [Rotaria sordida]
MQRYILIFAVIIVMIFFGIHTTNRMEIGKIKKETIEKEEIKKEEITKEKILLVTAIPPAPCKNPGGDFVNIQSIKNKLTYCQIKSFSFHLNTVKVDPLLTGPWNKLALVHYILEHNLDYDWIICPFTPSLIPSIPVSIVAEPLLHKIARQVEGIHHEQGIQQVQNVPALQDIQHVSCSPQVQGALSLSHPQQISITTDSTRYAQTRYPFPSIIIRFKAGKVTSNQIKEALTAHFKLELSSPILREELLIKRKITVGHIVYDIDQYLTPANI